MMLYEYQCMECGDKMEMMLPMDERDKPVGTVCPHCNEGNLMRCVGNAGFSLGQDGAVGWSKDGYATTYGDAENFKAGRKVY